MWGKWRQERERNVHWIIIKKAFSCCCSFFSRYIERFSKFNFRVGFSLHPIHSLASCVLITKTGWWQQLRKLRYAFHFHTCILDTNKNRLRIRRKFSHSLLMSCCHTAQLSNDCAPKRFFYYQELKFFGMKLIDFLSWIKRQSKSLINYWDCDSSLFPPPFSC